MFTIGFIHAAQLREEDQRTGCVANSTVVTKGRLVRTVEQLMHAAAEQKVLSSFQTQGKASVGGSSDPR